MRRELNDLVQRKAKKTSSPTKPKHTFVPRTENLSQVQFTEKKKLGTSPRRRK
jgi:hypothetical protein